MEVEDSDLDWVFAMGECLATISVRGLPVDFFAMGECIATMSEESVDFTLSYNWPSGLPTEFHEPPKMEPDWVNWGLGWELEVYSVEIYYVKWL